MTSYGQEVKRQRTYKALAVEWVTDAISNMEMAKHCLKVAGDRCLVNMAELHEVIQELDNVRKFIEKQND